MIKESQRGTHVDKLSTRRRRLSIIISPPAMYFIISCRGTCMLHSTANLIVVITSIESAGASLSSVHSLGMIKIGKLISRQRFLKFLYRSRRMIDFTPTNRLSTHLETTGKESSGRYVREDESRWRRSLAVIVVAPTFDWTAFLLTAAARYSITMRNCTCME